MKAIGVQPDYALVSVHAVTLDGTLVIASASGSQLASYAWGAANVIFVVGVQKLVPTLAAAHDRIRRPARPRRGGIRLRPGQHRGGGADPPGCGQRPGFGPGAGHANPVHRRHRPPRRLRPARPAGRAGPMSCPARGAPAEGDQKPRRSLTMIAVTRPGVTTLLMMRMLFTPLGTP